MRQMLSVLLMVMISVTVQLFSVDNSNSARETTATRCVIAYPSLNEKSALSVMPDSIDYPFHTKPGGQNDSFVVISNSTDDTTFYFALIDSMELAGWLSFGGGDGDLPSGVLGPGQSQVVGIHAIGPATEGYFRARIVFVSSGSNDSAVVRVSLYNFNTFYEPIQNCLRSSCARISVNQTGQSTRYQGKNSFWYSADNGITLWDIGYIRNAYLILGSGNEELSLGSTLAVQGLVTSRPSNSNPFGYMYAANEMGCEPCTLCCDCGSAIERRYFGKGYNRDSTLQYDARFFASKIPDSCNFFVIQFMIYKGPKAGVVNNLTVAYFCDWDIPSTDSGSYNYGGCDPSRYMLYQRGAFPGGPSNNSNRYGALGGAIEGGRVVGGFVVDNSTYIYPNWGWENDSLWNRMNILAQDQYLVGPCPDIQPTPPPVADDLSMVLVLAKNQTVATTADTVFAGVVLAGQPVSGGSLSGLKTAMDQGYKFMCNRNLVPGAPQCAICKCGDADNSGAWSISDAVFLISYIFSGGPAPARTCQGDADGSKAISISDAVYLINYIFTGGPAPSGCQ